MRSTLNFLVGIAILSFIGCASKAPDQRTQEAIKSHLKLSSDEYESLKCKKNCTLSLSLRKRLINNSEELKLTPQEMEVLKRTGKVILCGKCGHLLGTDKYKKWESEHASEYKPGDDFVPNSLRDRILKITTD